MRLIFWVVTCRHASGTTPTARGYVVVCCSCVHNLQTARLPGDWMLCSWVSFLHLRMKRLCVPRRYDARYDTRVDEVGYRFETQRVSPSNRAVHQPVHRDHWRPLSVARSRWWSVPCRRTERTESEHQRFGNHTAYREIVGALAPPLELHRYGSA
jgi:hypothetical protein